MLPETIRLINLLKICLRILGISYREVARRLEMSPSYVSKLFSGSSEMRLDHVIRVCQAVELDPAEFFALAYPTPERKSSVAATQLREVLRSASPAPPSRPEKEAEQLEAALRSMLAKMLIQEEGGVRR